MKTRDEGKVFIGYHASHEQFPPDDLLRYVQQAEEAGFNAAMSSDHFHPWSEQQGEAGFAWSWLGAALQATTLPCGVVNAPGQRYHPAIIAQAAATLEVMYPGRFWLAVGSGEALNEHITGDEWPVKERRNRRLEESVTVMRALWAGECVSHAGTFRSEEARLYTRPSSPPPVIGAAVTAETAGWLASWADGLVTVSRSYEEMQRVVTAFREGGGEGKPIYLQVHLSYAPTLEEAQRGAYEQWRTNIFKSRLLENLRLPQQFEAAAEYVRPEDMTGHVRVSAELEEHLAWLKKDLELGFDHLYLHNVNRDQEGFIEAFGRQVVPELRK